MPDQFTTVTLPICSGLLILAGLILAQSRTLRRDMTQMETRLREDMRHLREDMRQDTAALHQDMKELRGEVSDLRDRMGRIEGTLDILRQFFLDSGRGTAA
ncbi:MAG: hypothetical protein OXU64_03135 [Gemmatimonadota bacterium]|nr:hypothetical protein [Gemmatimonadota bacterium]